MATGYTYKATDPGLWTVGHYDENNKWLAESDHESPLLAAARVVELNGGKAKAEWLAANYNKGKAEQELTPGVTVSQIIKQELGALTIEARATIEDRPKATPAYFVQQLARLMKDLGTLEEFVKARL